VCCYTEVKRVGRTSITLDVEVWVLRQGQGARVWVTEAEFTFVSVGEDGRPRQLGSSNATPAPSAGLEPRRTGRQKTRARARVPR
jgi:acyl-CoA thioesterase YciA